MAMNFSFNQLADDFRRLDPQDPGLWPLGPRLVILILFFLGLVFVAWSLSWSSQLDALDAAQKTELSLKEEWLNKKRQTVNLAAYKQQKEDIDRAFGELLKQLPNKSEMDAMIVDISQTALSRGLKVELFRPNKESLRDFYAEVPISVTLTGSYNDLAFFASDLARLHRIVTLNNLNIKPARTNTLTLDGVVMTYRYLDSEEMSSKKPVKKPAGAAK